MSANKPLIKPNTLLLVIALSFGTAAAVSYAFHVGVAQNLTRLNKVVYFLFAAVPFSTLFYLVLHRLTRSARRRALLMTLALSLLLALGLSLFAYPQIKPVMQHALTLSLPAETVPKAAYSLKITAVEVHDRVIQPLALELLHADGNAAVEKDGISMSAGSSVRLSAQYSGNLRVYLLPSQCPMPIEVIIDDQASTQDACAVDPSTGLTFGEEGTGSLTTRWTLLLQLLKGLDFLLFTLLSAALLLLFQWLFTLIRLGAGGGKDAAPRAGARFLLDSALVLIIVTAVIFMANLLAVVLLLPLLVFLGFDLLFLTRPAWKGKAFSLYATILAFFITAIVLNVTARSLYSRYLRPIPVSQHDSANSFNALVLSVFNGFEDSLLYGYDDVLRGRQLILSTETSQLLDPEVDLETRLQLSDLRVAAYDPQITRADFDWLLTQKHRVWESGEWYRFYFMDGSAYQPAEAVVVREYEEWVLLLPAAVNERLGGK